MNTSIDLAFQICFIISILYSFNTNIKYFSGLILIFNSLINKIKQNNILNIDKTKKISILKKSVTKEVVLSFVVNTK